jgi:hypothetical protein
MDRSAAIKAAHEFPVSRMRAVRRRVCGLAREPMFAVAGDGSAMRSVVMKPSATIAAGAVANSIFGRAVCFLMARFLMFF